MIRDLIVDMTQFFKQYHSIKPPYLRTTNRPPSASACSRRRSAKSSTGLYECILCACCSTSCPSFWWNPTSSWGPAGLLAAYRFIADTRDQATPERLDNLEDPYRLFRCHTIMNCVDVCPKNLNPTRAIGKIKDMMVRRPYEYQPGTRSLALPLGIARAGHRIRATFPCAGLRSSHRRSSWPTSMDPAALGTMTSGPWSTAAKPCEVERWKGLMALLRQVDGSATARRDQGS